MNRKTQMNLLKFIFFYCSFEPFATYKGIIQKKKRLPSTSRKVSPNTCTQIDEQPALWRAIRTKVCSLLFKLAIFTRKALLIFHKNIPKNIAKVIILFVFVCYLFINLRFTQRFLFLFADSTAIDKSYFK